MFQFDADLKTLETGVWAEYAGARFLIAHISNLKFQRALSRYQQPYKKKIENGSLDPKTNRDLLCKAMAEGVLLNWDGPVDASKQKVDYTAERGFTALTQNVEFRDFVSEFATQMMNYRTEELENLGNG